LKNDFTSRQSTPSTEIRSVLALPVPVAAGTYVSGFFFSLNFCPASDGSPLPSTSAFTVSPRVATTTFPNAVIGVRSRSGKTLWLSAVSVARPAASTRSVPLKSAPFLSTSVTRNSWLRRNEPSDCAVASGGGWTMPLIEAPGALKSGGASSVLATVVTVPPRTKRKSNRIAGMST
jgi:hypothetical protein